jgi:microcystin-dependent protein
MGNCSNITNTQTVSLDHGTLTPGFCHESLQTTFEEFVDQTTGQLEGAMAAFTAGDDTPNAIDQTKLWYKQDGSNCNLPGAWYFYNGTSTAWEPVQASDPSPIGSIVMYGGAASPNTNWLICNGGPFNVTTYATLNTILGTTYGVAGTLPDLRSRVPVGYNTDTLSGRSTRALSDTGGAETHTLLEEEMPSHSHAMNTGSSTSGVASLEGNDLHWGSSKSLWYGTSAVTGSTGDSDPHENMQPFVTVNFIIRGL